MLSSRVIVSHPDCRATVMIAQASWEPACHDGSATVVERLGRMTGYASSIGIHSHAAGDTTEDLMALIGAATSIIGSGFVRLGRRARRLNGGK